MGPSRTLLLKREALTELTTDDLRQVVGAYTGTATSLTQILSCPGTCASWHTEEC